MEIVSFLLIGILIICMVVLYIKGSYEKFDRNETAKEEIALLKNKIQDAKDYFREKYNTEIDKTVYDNIKVKVDFLTQLISKNKDITTQKKHLNELFNMLYETEIRLRTNYDNVQYVTAPLNNLRDKIVEEHLDYIRENSDI